MKTTVFFFQLVILLLFSCQLFAQPSNDLCIDAILLECDSLKEGSIATATNIDALPPCITSPGDTIDTYIGVWYTFPGTGDRVNISTDVVQTNFNTEIQIFIGSCGALTCVDGNDNGGNDYVGGLTSEYEFVTLQDSTYYIYVDGNSLDTGSYGIVLTCNPCNDYVVTDTADSGEGTLRDIIACAQSGTTITFSPTIDGLPINLHSGPIIIQNKELTILGNDASLNTIDGSLDGNNRLFLIEDNAYVTFKDLKFQHGGGNAFNSGGAGFLVQSNASLRFARCTLSNNETLNNGASIYVVNGNAKAINCIFKDNIANHSAVAHLEENSLVSLQQCLLIGNSSIGYSIANASQISSTLEILQSTVADNISTNNNQPINSVGKVTLINSIFHNNGADPINNSGTLIVRNNLLDLPGTISLDSNFVGDPFFMNSAAGNYQLSDSSMAIDMGDHSFFLVDSCDVDNDSIVFEIVTVDLLQNERRKKCRIDIGAYENAGALNEYFVFNSNDADRGSLREAILCAPDGATIRFLSATNGMPIQLSSGQIVIGRDIKIIGNGQTNTIIDGSLDPAGRLFVTNLSNNAEFRNMTFREGGGPSGAFGGAILSYGKAKFISCTFHDNQGSNGGALGGGTAAHLDVINSTFYNNNCSSQGGAINYSFSANIIGNLFYNNSAGSLGGAIICSGGSANMINNTLAHNNAVTAGGAILNNGTIVRLDNNIISNNTSAAGPNFYDNGPAGNVTNSRNNLMNDTTNSNLNTGVTIGSPSFVDVGAGNYQLDSGSLGINSGDLVLVPLDTCDVDNDGNLQEKLPIDLLGNMRITACQVDIGAMENLFVTCDTGLCLSPIPLLCGIPYQGSTSYNANLHDTYSCTGRVQNGPEIIHEFTVAAAGDITVTLSNLSTDLDVFLINDCSLSSSCLAFGDSTLSAAVTPGVYYIVVDGYSGAAGNYTINVNCSQAIQPCINNNLTINNPLSPAGSYHAINEIISNATVTNSGVQYLAGNSILLNPEFETILGVEFDVLIMSCP